jgi:hypothetical protein
MDSSRLKAAKKIREWNEKKNAIETTVNRKALFISNIIQRKILSFVSPSYTISP